MMMVIGGPKMAKGDDEEKSYGKDEEKESEGGDLMSMGGKKAAKDVLQAIESGDASALHKALKAHYTACQDSE